MPFSHWILISLCFSLSVSVFISCVSSDPPVFTMPENETLKLPAGGKIILNCTAAGNPVPVYSWRSPHSVQRKNRDQNENEPILTPSFQLPGTYTCTVSNSLGNKTKYFTVMEAASKILFLKSFCFSACSTPSLSCSVNCSITPSCYCFPSGSHPGTTAGILMAVFFVLIFILGCVVYHKQRSPSVARPDGLNR